MTQFSHAQKVAGLVARLLPPETADELVKDDAFFQGGGPTGEASASEMRRAQDALATLRTEAAADPRNTAALEAIILPRLRPVIDVIQNDFAVTDALWAHLATDAAATHLRHAIPAVGRVELPGQTTPYAGTAFVVGPGLMMTNRHVAAIFAQGLGRSGLSYLPGYRVAANMHREAGFVAEDDDKLNLPAPRVRMIHPYWDMALIEVEGLGAIEPLTLSLEAPDAFVGREVAVIGYPALDDRNDIDLQMRIFRRLFRVKRLQPGKATGTAQVTDSFGNTVRAVTHDASTLGGNSGSAVVCTMTGRVLGLHFAGRYLEANYAVPAQELGRDRHVRAAGVQFDGGAADPTTAWDPAWARADGEAVAGTVVTAQVATGAAGTMTVTLPVTISLTVGLPTVTQPTTTVAATERIVMPPVDRDYAGRPGYAAGFLGIEVPMPSLSDNAVAPPRLDGVASPVLTYHNLSILMHAARRLALCTAANVDGSAAAKLPEPFRDYTRAALSGVTSEDDREGWMLDPRIAAQYQLPDVFYNADRQAFDKGHLARREDMAFGPTYDALRHSNNDTYHCTNCSPQVMGFNRFGLWRTLEQAVLTQGKAERYCIFSGAVFRDDDPEFEGRDDAGPIRVRIPVRYWKLLVCVEDGALAAHGFVLKQDLSNVAFTAAEFQVPKLLAEQMVPLADLQARLAPLILPAAVLAADRYASEAARTIRTRSGATEGMDWSIWD